MRRSSEGRAEKRGKDAKVVMLARFGGHSSCLPWWTPVVDGRCVALSTMIGREGRRVTEETRDGLGARQSGSGEGRRGRAHLNAWTGEDQLKWSSSTGWSRSESFSSSLENSERLSGSYPKSPTILPWNVMKTEKSTSEDRLEGL